LKSVPFIVQLPFGVESENPDSCKGINGRFVCGQSLYTAEPVDTPLTLIEQCSFKIQVEFKNVRLEVQVAVTSEKLFG
jgi:hypothetical protein